MSDLSTVEGCTAAIETAVMERPLDAAWLAECYEARAELWRKQIWEHWSGVGGTLTDRARAAAIQWERDLGLAARWARGKETENA